MLLAQMVSRGRESGAATRGALARRGRRGHARARRTTRWLERGQAPKLIAGGGGWLVLGGGWQLRSRTPSSILRGCTHALCCACFYAQPVCYCWLYFAPMRSMRTANLSPNRRIVTRFKKNTHANVSIVCTSSDYPSDSKSIMQGPEPGLE